MAPDLLRDLDDPHATWVVLVDNSGSMALHQERVSRTLKSMLALGDTGRQALLFASLPSFRAHHPLVHHDRYDPHTVEELQTAMGGVSPSGPGTDLSSYLPDLIQNLADRAKVGRGPLRVFLLDDFCGPLLPVDVLRQCARERGWDASLIGLNMEGDSAAPPEWQKAAVGVEWGAARTPGEWAKNPSLKPRRRLEKAARQGKKPEVDRLLTLTPTARPVAAVAAAQAPTPALLQALWSDIDAVVRDETLAAAAQAGRLATVAWLLPRVPDAAAQARALKAAAAAGQMPVLTRLLDEPQARTIEAVSAALASALRKGHHEAAHALLDAVPSHSLPPSPLLEAIRRDHTDIIEAVAARTDMKAAAPALARAWFRVFATDQEHKIFFDGRHRVVAPTAYALAAAVGRSGHASRLFRLILNERGASSHSAYVLLDHVSNRALRWGAELLARKNESPLRCLIESTLLTRTLPSPSPRGGRARM